MSRWIVASGCVHGPDPDRAAFDPEAESIDWIEIDAPDAATALEVARLADDDPGVLAAVTAFRAAGRAIEAARSLPYVTRRDLEPLIRQRADHRSRLATVLAQAGMAVRSARPWTLDETLDRRRRWYALLRAGLSPAEIERQLGYSGEALAAAVRRHELS